MLIDPRGVTPHGLKHQPKDRDKKGKRLGETPQRHASRL